LLKIELHTKKKEESEVEKKKKMMKKNKMEWNVMK